MSHLTEIKIPNGKMKCMAQSEVLKKTKCFKCQKEIYIVYTTHGVKLPVSKRGDELVSHGMECDHSPLVKEERRKAKQQKEYEKNIQNRNAGKRSKKVRYKGPSRG